MAGEQCKTPVERSESELKGVQLTEYCIEGIRSHPEAVWMLTERLLEGNKRAVRQVLVAIANGTYGETESKGKEVSCSGK